MKNYLLLIVFGLSSVQAKENIFDKMDEKTAVTTGIYKLSEKEKRALASWLNNSEIETAKEIIKKEKTKNMGFKNNNSERTIIISSIVGEFRGWDGKTVFELANGQKWKQVDKSQFSVRKMIDPKVTVRPKSFGSWVLNVEGYNRGVKVKRTQ